MCGVNENRDIYTHCIRMLLQIYKFFLKILMNLPFYLYLYENKQEMEKDYTEKIQ